MRVFIAINLPDNVKKALEQVILALKKYNKENPPSLKLRRIKWIEPQLLHITLHFLGDLEQNEADKVKEVLENTVKQFLKVKFKLGELGGFPDLKNPRIIFVKGIEIGGGQVIKLHHELFGQLKELDFEVEDRQWIPHITIGRVKGRDVQLKVLDQIANLLQLSEQVVWEVSSVDLMESVLKPDGPEYKVLKKFELK